MHISERLPRESSRDYALRIIKDNIISLRLEPGSQISENELATEMGLSRTPVREALIELAKVKIIETYPQRKSRLPHRLRSGRRVPIHAGCAGVRHRGAGL